MLASVQQLQELMKEVENEDPIDFADLPFEEDDLRLVTANHICQMAAALENFTEEDRHLTLLAVAAKLVLENMVLHIRLIRQHGQNVELDIATILQAIRDKK
jgi:malonyl CoA-acyl carrier protein transacylase